MVPPVVGGAVAPDAEVAPVVQSRGGNARRADLPDGDAWDYIKVNMRTAFFYFGYFWGFPVAGGMSRREC